MTIFPAIDLFEGQAVRLIRGDYEQMTVYSDDPVATALGFKAAGAEAIHIVDLEGARSGEPANFEIIKKIVAGSGLEIQVGGGVRTADSVKKYMSIGVKRVILGTAAVSEQAFLAEMVKEYSEAIAVSADIKDGVIAIKGWTELSGLDLFDFCRTIVEIGVKTLVCTDISKDGLLGGTNIELYRRLKNEVSIKLIASGGVSSLDEISTLSSLGMDGAILGTAIYTGKINLADAVKIT